MSAMRNSMSFPAAAATALSTYAQDRLTLLREQVKLARDVYAALHTKWGAPVFQTTAASEGLHMASVKLLLDWYDLDDPVGAKPPGLFADERLQAAYADLVVRGAASLEEAYGVGIALEKQIIALLRDLIGDNRPRDVGLVAETLLSSAQNHLTTFNSFLDRCPGRQDCREAAPASSRGRDVWLVASPV